MIPVQVELPVIATGTLPGRTFEIDFDAGRVVGVLDELSAVGQAVRLALATERYRHLIYSYAYGFEGTGLLGRPLSYLYMELKRRITEALTQDDRIRDVTDFSFSRTRGRIHVSFRVETVYGVLEDQISIEN